MNARSVRHARKKSPARGPRRPATRPAPQPDPEEPQRSESTLGSLLGSLAGLSGLTSDLTSSALRLASRTREGASRVIARTPEQLRMMASAGESLRDIRKVAGMTVNEVTSALNLRDKGIWEAVEDGREVLSFELILRLASLVARNDPLPFVLRYTRSYHPRLWEILHELKIDQLPLQFARERDFINIYRRHDLARTLSDTDFERVLRFTRDAFDLAMHFVTDRNGASPVTTAADGAKGAPAEAGAPAPSPRRRPGRNRGN